MPRTLRGNLEPFFSYCKRKTRATPPSAGSCTKLLGGYSCAPLLKFLSSLSCSSKSARTGLNREPEARLISATHWSNPSLLLTRNCPISHLMWNKSLIQSQLYEMVLQTSSPFKTDMRIISTSRAGTIGPWYANHNHALSTLIPRVPFEGEPV